MASTACDKEYVPWLTVVMPVHNGARYLSATLDSLCAEVGDGIEIILIDSSDDDSCEEIVRTYQGRLTIDYDYRPDIKPWTAKTNMAVERARAPHIAMLHQDDLWLPGRAKVARAAINRHPEAIMHLFPSRFIDDLGRDLGRWDCPLAQQQSWYGAELMERLLVQNFVAIPAPVICKEAWLAVRGLDDALWYTADWDLYLKLAAHGEVAYRSEPTTAFRLHGQSLTVLGSRDLDGFHHQIQTVIDRHLPQLDDITNRAAVRQIAGVSMMINVALAAVAAGNWRPVWRAVKALACLPPQRLAVYFHRSRLLDRIIPRFRAFYGARL